MDKYEKMIEDGYVRPSEGGKVMDYKCKDCRRQAQASKDSDPYHHRLCARCFRRRKENEK